MIIWERFRKNIFENKLVSTGDKILLAVSGGADSMVMASLFARLKKIINIDFMIVNFNHNLRKESAKEAKLVKNFADSLKVKCILKELKTKKYAKEKNISLETAGRQLRYMELEKTAKEYKCNKIATAHNMNDNAETILMWILRGTGSEGLNGIPLTRNLTKKISIIRPILSISRDMIDDYTKKNKIKFCTDKTNFKCDYTRNKIRLNIIPALKKINPLFIEHVYNLSAMIKGETAYFKKKINSFIAKNIKFTKNKISINLNTFKKQDKTLQYKILKEIFPDKKRAVHINQVINWLADGKNNNYVLSKKWNLKKNKQLFTVINLSKQAEK